MSKRRQFPECPAVLVSLHACTSEEPSVVIKICESDEMSVEAFEAFLEHGKKVLEASKRIESEQL